MEEQPLEEVDGREKSPELAPKKKLMVAVKGRLRKPTWRMSLVEHLCHIRDHCVLVRWAWWVRSGNPGWRRYFQV